MLFLMLILCITSSFTSPNRKINTLKKHADGRIIGGKEAMSGQFPFLASIHTTTSDGNYFCAGTLLNNQWILTAGQCVDGVKIFNIRLGTNLLKGEDPYAVSVSSDTYVLHPDYDPMTLDNDVGLIMLHLPVQFSDYLQPVYYLPFDPLLTASSVLAIGWGQISDNQAGLVNHLRFVFVSVLSHEECQLVYGNQVTENMVCVGGNYNEGTCIGDSGGPLIEFIDKGFTAVVGISSFLSQNGCESTDPSGFIRVFGYNDWIRNVTGRS